MYHILRRRGSASIQSIISTSAPSTDSISGIARVELFLGMTATFQHYKITACVGEKINLEYPASAILAPKVQNVRI